MIYTPVRFISDMEISSDNGLTVTFDDETGTITLDWDPETHPEYNIFEGITSEQFCQILFEHYEKISDGESTTSEIPTGGQSCGTAESDCDSGVES